MTSGAGSFACNTLHRTTVTKEAVGVVAEEVVAWLVENGPTVPLGNGQANCIGKSLTERTSCDFNTLGSVALRMTWGDAINVLWEPVSSGHK